MYYHNWLILIASIAAVARTIKIWWLAYVLSALPCLTIAISSQTTTVFRSYYITLRLSRPLRKFSSDHYQPPKSVARSQRSQPYAQPCTRIAPPMAAFQPIAQFRSISKPSIGNLPGQWKTKRYLLDGRCRIPGSRIPERSDYAPWSAQYVSTFTNQAGKRFTMPNTGLVYLISCRR